MKRIFLMIGILACTMHLNVRAQRVIWQDDFETSKGWSEFEDEDGKAIVKDGALMIKSNEGWQYISRCKTNLDGNKNFTISVDVNLKDGLGKGRYVGMIFDFSDRKNYKMFYIEEGLVRFAEYRDGYLVREEKDVLKKQKKKEKKSREKGTQITFEIQKKGQSVMFLVNEEETLEMDGIIVKSNRIGFMVAEDQEVLFDNVKIMQ